MAHTLPAPPSRSRHRSGFLLTSAAGLLLLLGTVSTPVQVASPIAAPQPSSTLPPSPPPLATLELADPALTLEVVAAEPLVQSPIAITFDERGRMFVVEMIDYPHDRGRHPGRISLLEDADADGRYERATVFADDLPWPSGAISYDGGLFVAASPDILYLKDTDDDGRADVREVIVTGFANTLPEPMPDMVVNGFAWGLDNRLYGATSRNGGIVSAPGSDETHDLRGRDFSIDPRTRTLRPETGGGQFGVTFDAAGRRFVSSNANHLMQAMYELRYATRNPHVEYPRPMLDIPEDGPAAPVYRVSPDEAWRVQRTQWRASGKVRGLIEYGGRPSGYFTSACSLTIYDGDVLPAEYRGSAFVAEPANNLVHRKQLEDAGIPLRGVRPAREQGTEFLRSTSVWFRPVNFATGPDGALYIVDMHRFVVEDPKTIPAGILGDDDVAAGRASGRIYRVTRKGAPRTVAPALDREHGAVLAGRLAHPNGWVRETAARLLYERQDQAAVPAVAALAGSSPEAAVRLRALHVLDGLGSLTAAHVRNALQDADPEVRRHAIALGEAFGDDDAVRQALLGAVDDPSPRVRQQLAFTLGVLPGHAAVLDTMVTLAARHADDPWMRMASLTSIGDAAVPVLERLATDQAFIASAGGDAFVGQVMATIGARGRQAEVAATVPLIVGASDETRQLRWTRDLFGGLARGGVGIAQVDPGGRLAPVLALAQRVAASASAGVEARVSAFELLAQDPRVGHQPFLAAIGPSEPAAVQRAALAALRARDHEAIAETLLARFESFTPQLRQESLAVLLARPERALRLLDAVENERVPRSDLSAGQVQALMTHGDAAVARRAAALLDLGASTRQQVVDGLAPALALPADAARGQAVFANVCASCHRLDGVGIELGPSLAGVRTHGRDGLLIDIFDPNRKVDPGYLYYEVERRDGTSAFGAIVEDTAGSLTIAQASGPRIVIPRADILHLRSTGRSMMPDGLESSMSPQQVADLLEYLLGR